jgi:uncharacterized protein YbjT (DUF2867 family)
MAAPETILVLGGTGFVGRHLVAQLAARGYRVTVLTRRRVRARHLILLPTVDVIEGDPYDRGTLLQLATPATAAINLVGVLHEQGANTFARAHVALPRLLVDACRTTGVRRILHMSALNADAVAGPSRYLRSKGEGEAVIAASGLDYTIFRPSVIFGREDRFLNLFARLARFLPVLAVAAPESRFQPIYVNDVAHCFVHALEDDATIGERYNLCGPTVYRLRDLVRYAAEVSGHRRPVIGLGPVASKLQALALELLPGTLMTRDNLASMSQDSVCDAPFPAIFRLTPTALEAVAPSWLGPDALKPHYTAYREHSGR